MVRLLRLWPRCTYDRSGASIVIRDKGVVRIRLCPHGRHGSTDMPEKAPPLQDLGLRELMNS